MPRNRPQSSQRPLAEASQVQTFMRTVVLGFTALFLVASFGQICDAKCKVDDACDRAARSIPLYPATLGEALDARRALDIACQNYRACIEREDANLLPTEPEPPTLPDLHEVWRKRAEAEKERAAREKAQQAH
jgi:hypothetical protein